MIKIWRWSSHLFRSRWHFLYFRFWPNQELDWTKIWSVSYSCLVVHMHRVRVNSSSGYKMCPANGCRMPRDCILGSCTWANKELIPNWRIWLSHQDRSGTARWNHVKFFSFNLVWCKMPHFAALFVGLRRCTCPFLRSHPAFFKFWQ
jgi:hypothetical protein